MLKFGFFLDTDDEETDELEFKKSKFYKQKNEKIVQIKKESEILFSICVEILEYDKYYNDALEKLNIRRKYDEDQFENAGFPEQFKI